MKTALAQLQKNGEGGIQIPMNANGTADYSSAINEILNKLKFMERSLESKVDSEVFDNETSVLRAMIGNLEEEDKAKSKYSTS